MWADIRTKVRYILGDILQTGKDIFTYGSSNIFTLTESNAVAVYDVAVNDVGSAITWTYNPTSNKVTLGSGLSLTAGDIVEISYGYYSNYSETELDGYIHNAVAQITMHNYGEFYIKSGEIYPDCSLKDENLIAVIAAVIAKPNNMSWRLPDITVTAPIYAELPLDKKISRLIAIAKKDTGGLFFIA
jgi:hypothetical protein